MPSTYNILTLNWSCSDVVDSEYGYIPAKCWHNSAAEISQEVEDPAEAAQTWRKYQFLHLFHFCSHVLRFFCYDEWENVSNWNTWRLTRAKFVLHLSQLGGTNLVWGVPTSDSLYCFSSVWAVQEWQWEHYQGRTNLELETKYFITFASVSTFSISSKIETSRLL